MLLPVKLLPASPSVGEETLACPQGLEKLTFATKNLSFQVL